MEGVYKIAEHTVRIRSIYPDVHRMCVDYVTGEPPEYCINISEGDLAFERSMAAKSDPMAAKYRDGYLETLAVYRKLVNTLLSDEIVLFHGSVVAVDHAAYLFTAKSGTGKSTHTRLWVQRFGPRAIMVNDDKPLLKISENGVIAYGTPWNGKHRLGANISVPLEAVCILERGKTNEIRQITFREAMPMLMQQIYRPADIDGMQKTIRLCESIGTTVRLYRLKCTMDPEAAEVAYHGMTEGKS